MVPHPEGWKRVFGVIVDALNYPIIATQPRPITVVTLLCVALFLVGAFWVSRRLQATLRSRVLTRLGLDPGLEFSILRFVHYAVLAIAMLFALETLHIDLTGLAVVAGILSVGIGFGLQNLASNFISGLILLIERPITVGDQVTVGDVDGHVRAINMRATEIVTGDNISIIVPNSEFISGRVVNWSHGDPKLRLRLPVGVSYRSDVEHVREVLLGVARRCDDVLEDPAPDVDFVRFGQSSLDLELHAWIADPDRRDEITTALHFAIRSAFLDENIEIPFPQYELHFRPEGDAGDEERGGYSPRHDPDRAEARAGSGRR
jgi:small-conductance mechanosensitive channel